MIAMAFGGVASADEAAERAKALGEIREAFKSAKESRELEIEKQLVVIEKAKTPAATTSAKAKLETLKTDLAQLEADPIKAISVKNVPLVDIWSTKCRTGQVIKVYRAFTVSEPKANDVIITAIETFKGGEQLAHVTLEESTTAKKGEKIHLDGWFEIVSRSEGVKKAVILKRIEWTKEELASISRK